jgi:hypothetical protein
VVLLLFWDNGKISWQEEVKLSTGETILVDQKRQCVKANTGGLSSDCLARDAWLTIKKSNFSNESIKWHENLIPMILNSDREKLFLVAYPPTELEYKKYNVDDHPYFGFVWDRTRWQRIKFEEIPTSIYDTNMVINNPPLSGKKFIDLETKKLYETRGGAQYLRISIATGF